MSTIASSIRNLSLAHKSRRPVTQLAHIVAVPGTVDRHTLRTVGVAGEATITLPWRIDNLPSEGALVDMADLLEAIGKVGTAPDAEYCAGDRVRLRLAGASLSVVVGECMAPAVPEPAGGFGWPMEWAYAHGVDLAAAMTAIARDRSSPILSGAMVQLAHDGSMFACTDGKYLVEAGPRLEPEHGAQIVMPAEIAEILSGIPSFRLRKAERGNVLEVEATDEHRAWHVRIVCRLIDGTFPRYTHTFNVDEAQPFDGATAIAAAAQAGAGLPPARAAVVVCATGATPLTVDAGGRTVAAAIDGVDGRFGIDSRYCTHAAKIAPADTVWHRGRGIFGMSDSARVLIMPISLPDGVTDCTGGAPLAVGRAVKRSVKREAPAAPVDGAQVASLSAQVASLSAQVASLSAQVASLSVQRDALVLKLAAVAKAIA